MKKLFKMTMILLILIFSIQFQMNMSYAVPNSGAPEGAYTDSGSEQRAKEKDEQIKQEIKSNSKGTSTGIGQSTEWSHEGADYYKPIIDDDDTGLFDNKVGYILGAIRAVGILVSIGALMVIGTKTMIGSVEEKSHYKEVLPGYILGAVMVMAITCIPSIIYDLMQSFN